MNIGLIKIIIFVTLLVVSLWFFLHSDSNDKIISDIPAKTGAEIGFKVIAFGDSLTAGFGLPEGDSYPAQLETALHKAGYVVSVVNAGISGETTEGNLKRAADIRAQSPDIVLLGIGGNDALRKMSVMEAKKNILATVSVLQAGNNPPLVVLLKMQASPTSGLSYKKEFDNIYEEVATEKRLVLVPFITAELFIDPKNKLNDGLHYNALGYQKVIDTYLLPILSEILDKLKGK